MDYLTFPGTGVSCSPRASNKSSGHIWELEAIKGVF